MRMLDCFSGIGGFTYAARKVWGNQLQTVAFIEQDIYCAYVLTKNFPDIPIQKEIRNYEPDGAAVDLLSAGWPCQPVSQTGHRKGAGDDRWVWPQTAALIQATRPRWFIGENVAGIISLELDQVLSDLEDLDYTSWPFIVPAAAADAWHRRDRVWIVSHSPEIRQQEIQTAWLHANGWTGEQSAGQPAADTVRSQLEELRPDWEQESAAPAAEALFRRDHQGDKPIQWEPEPGLVRLVHGVSPDVHRFTALGNAIVPQVAMIFFEAIKEVERWR